MSSLSNMTNKEEELLEKWYISSKIDTIILQVKNEISDDNNIIKQWDINKNNLTTTQDSIDRDNMNRTITK